jgi:protein O-mannosyl-transferase
LGQPSSSRDDVRRTAAAILIAVIAAFGPSLRNEFTYDEPMVIVDAEPFLAAPQWRSFVSPDYFLRSNETTYRPLVTLTYVLDRQISGGTDPIVYKAQSIAWHGLAAVLVAAVARTLVAFRWAPLVAGLMFALHPVTTEVVDNASFREDAMAAAFGMSALLFAWRDRNWLALISFAAALLSKESAIAIPLLLALSWTVVGSPRSRMRRIAGLVAVALAYLIVRFGPMRLDVVYGQHPGGSLRAALSGMWDIFAHYLRLLVVPWPLCADYAGYFDFESRTLLPRSPGLLLAVAVSAAGVALYRRGHRAVAFGIGWFLIALLPVANVIPMPIPAAERFLYLPLVGVALAFAAGVGALMSLLTAAQRRAIAGAGVLLSLLFTLLVHARHRDWRDDRSLLLATVAVNPRSCRAQSAMGVGLLRRGLREGNSALVAAAAAKQRLALSLCPPSREPIQAGIALARLGGVQFHLGDRAGARDAFERANRLAPGYSLPLAWLALLAHADNDEGRAMAALQEVMRRGTPDLETQEVLRLLAGQ